MATRKKSTAPDPRDLTLETVADWNTGQKKCRARKHHSWDALTVYDHTTHFEVIEQCRYCKNRRTADFVKTTYGVRRATKWKPVYRAGYLLPKGGRITEDIADGLVAEDIMSRKILKAPEED